MSNVFISYAHSSPQHKGVVSQLVRTLRAHGISVDVDADVKTPQGPEEGWPRWMKRQIDAADWVLVFFDSLYRIRFDGEDDVGTGLGATWEGLIITHHFYRKSGRNTKFIPLLSDGADSKLIPDELFGFTRYCIPSQEDALAVAIGSSNCADSLLSIPPALKHPVLDLDKLSATGRLPFLEFTAQYKSYYNGCINFELSIRNLSDAVAVSPRFRLDNETNERPLKSLAGKEQVKLLLHWANLSGSNLDLKLQLSYSTLDGHKFCNVSDLSIRYFSSGQKLSVPELTCDLNSSRYVGAPSGMAPTAA